MRQKVGITRSLIDLHSYYLQNNKFDEGDLIYYKINYRLDEARKTLHGIHGIEITDMTARVDESTGKITQF
jgi:Dodecin